MSSRSPRGQRGPPPPYQVHVPTAPTANDRPPLNESAYLSRAQGNSIHPSTNPNEQTRLIPAPVQSYHSVPPGFISYREDKRKGVNYISLGIFLLVMFTLGGFVGRAIDRSRYDVMDPIVRERIRSEWAEEWREQEAQRHRWAVEQEDHDRRMEDERRRAAEERHEWELERRERDRIREEERQRERQKEQERQEEREREEQKRRDEEERQRLGLFWSDLKGAEHCRSYGTREYTAQLANLPLSYDRMKGCQGTPVVIHGVTLPTPDYCEDRGDWAGVHGRWIVNFDEVSCVPYWSTINDKGCTAQGSGLRRIEAHLENLQYGDDWNTMCSTTPADFHQTHFDGPTSCANWGKYGIWGIWEVTDSGC